MLGGTNGTLSKELAALFLPLLSWAVCANVRSTGGGSTARSRGGADRTEVGVPGPLDLLPAPSPPLPYTHLQIACSHSRPLRDLPHAPWTRPSGEDSQPHGAWSSFAWPKPVAAGGGPGVGAGAGTLHSLPAPGRPGPGTASHLQGTSGLFPWDLAPDMLSGCPPVARTSVGGTCVVPGCSSKGNNCPELPPKQQRPPSPAPTTLQPGRRILEQHRPGPGPYQEPEG